MAERMAGAQTAMEPTQVKIVQPETLLDRFQKLTEQTSRRAFEIFEGNGRPFGTDIENWFRAESEILHPVHLRLAEKDGALIVEAEVPGFEAKDLEVSFEGNRLTISGKKETKEEQKKGTTLYEEQCSNQLLRVIELPAEVDSAKATATVKNGRLEISVPKAAKVTAARVEVKAAA